jgi:penicillin-binding protein 2
LEENKLDLPGMIFEESPVRVYPNDARLTHVLGYLRTFTDQSNKMNDNYKLGDIYGFSGIEKYYESTLRGVDGTEFHLVDIYGIDHGLIDEMPPVLPEPGDAIYLSIDSELQFYVESLFINKKGAVICMDPLSGEVLAYLSSPDYDLNSFVGPVPKNIWKKWNDDKGFPLLNRVIQGLYPPGSTMKLIAAALALEEDSVSKNWKVDCNGTYKLGDRVFRCWNSDGHGKVNMKNAIINSCNIYFYKLIQELSFESWVKMAKKFGFGVISGIDQFGEKSGNVPNKEYMNQKYGRFGWSKGSLLTFVIGQGDILVTPIQVALMMNIIASEGSTYMPKINKNIISEKIELPLKKSTWKFINEALWSVVNNDNGTGKLASVDNVDVFGKTGTAQNPHGDDHSWFAGYMEIDGTPVISLTVLVENGGKGSIEGARISRNIFEFTKENEYNKSYNK